MPLPDNTSSLPQTQASPDDIAYVAATLQNPGNQGVGAILPNPQQGDFNIPLPSGFTATNLEDSFGGSVFRLTWLDVDPSLADIAGYNVWVISQFANQVQQTLISSAHQSPCVVRVISDTAQQVTFFLQPFLVNGQTIPLDSCPTTTGTTPEPSYIFTSGTTTAKIASGLPSGTGGSPVTGFNVSDTALEGQTTMAATFWAIINGNGETAAAAAIINDADAGSGGVIRCFNGDGTGKISNVGQTIRLNGDNSGNGKIDVWGDIGLENGTAADALTISPGSSAVATGAALAILNPRGYLVWNLGGNVIKIAYFDN